jgi:hypothetical protein
MSNLFVADLDRFLINTDAASDVLDQVCENVDIDAQDISNARLESEESGGSFDTWGYLKSFGSAALLDEVRQSFIDACKDSPIVYDDTAPLLAFFDENKIPNLIVTMGGDDWQKIKLEAGSLSERKHLITREKHKGKMIASWKREDGLYLPAGFSGTLGYETIDLGEDKAVSFDGLPDDCGGYLLRRPKERVKKSQQGEIPARIKRVGSLYEIIEDMQSNL